MSTIFLERGRHLLSFNLINILNKIKYAVV